MSAQRQKPIAVRYGVFESVLSHLYEIVYNPLRNGFVRVKDIDAEFTKNEISTTLTYLEDATPMGGLDVEKYRERNSTGDAWYVEECDVQGPLTYPVLTPDEIDCNDLRSRILDGECMSSVAEDMGINIRRARRHVYGRCDCEADVPPLRFKRTRGWVTR